MHLCRTQSWGVSLLLSYLGFWANSVLLAQLELDAGSALALALITPATIAWLAPEPLEAPSRRSVPRAEIALRMLAGALLVIAITAAAGTLGTTWSGLLTIFPIATSVLAVSSQRSGGPSQTQHLLRGLGVGLYGLTAFFATLAFALDRWSISATFIAATVVAASTQVAVFGALAYRSQLAPAPSFRK